MPADPLNLDYPVSFRLNGRAVTLRVPAWTTLLDLLRERLGLIGTRKGCDHGQCGACTVLADGRRINACLALAVMQNGKSITTIEGLADGDELHPMQRAFIHHDALQCGYCTPGQILSAVTLASECEGEPDEAQIAELMSGNICRCGAYPQIRAAVAEALPACRMREGGR